MSSSGLSDLSSPLSSTGDTPSDPIPKHKLDHYFKHGSSTAHSSPPSKKKRPPSPPHEYVLADNPDIAFICIFRSRFNEAFQKLLPHYGPQDIENGIIESPAGEQVERLLCALLGLVLNRKKDVEKGHYQRALEEAVHAHVSQWPAAWQGRNPLHGGGNFNNMTAEQRLTLMKALIVWALESSEAVKNIIKDSYKQTRHEDDLNQPLSVQPWGKDGDRRRFWLIEGQDDTHFRLYRESNPTLKSNTWRSIAGTIEEVKAVAKDLAEEDTQASRRLRDRINAAIPRFEASEDKRKRRDYRVARKAQFVRADPGFSLYEGRTRGKRARYTYSDEEGGSDAVSPRRFNRPSGDSTPAEATGPTFTASGRQVKARHGGAYGETSLTGQQDPIDLAQNNHDSLDGADEINQQRGRPKRPARENGFKPKSHKQRNVDGYDSEDDMNDESDITSSGNEWHGGDDDEADDIMNEDEDDDADMEMSDVAKSDPDSIDMLSDTSPQSGLMVTLRYARGRSPSSQNGTQGTPAKLDNSLATRNVAQQGPADQSKLRPYPYEEMAKPATDATSQSRASHHDRNLNSEQMPEYVPRAPDQAAAPSAMVTKPTQYAHGPEIIQHQITQSDAQILITPPLPASHSDSNPPGPTH